MSAPAPAPAYKTGIVKQVLSGDTVVIRKQPNGGPPPEKVIVLSGITAPKLARQKTANSDAETKDEPYAWEAREYLRKKLVGKEVIFTSEKPANSTTREYGTVWAGMDPTKDENVTEGLVAEGLAKVREGSRNIPALKRLVEIEEQAKSQGKGVWGNDLQDHIRDIKWSVSGGENAKQFVNKYNGKPIQAIVEYVRDGSTVRLFLLPDFYQITLMLSGIRCPAVKQDGDSELYAEQAKFFVESRLLQKNVEVILESVNNNNLVGTILHPMGNIAEHLLREGFARCVDWSLAVTTAGASTLRQAERAAKEARRRIWANYQSNAPTIAAKDKEFTGTVVEIVNGDALVVKMPNNALKKIFLASIRPPRETTEEGETKAPRPKGFRPLYDIPWMFEAREFLRKKLIGKKVNVVVDYIQPAKDNLPEKTCCTVTAGGQNVAEGLVAKGLATVVRYRNDNDQRSSAHDALLEAELKAQKALIGVHAKKQSVPVHRVQDTSGDAVKARKFFPFLKRAAKTEAIVEFVASGSRLRLYIPKESALVTFLAAGISCPRGARPAAGGGIQEAEPYGERALAFTRERVLHRDVHCTIEDLDKAGNFIGWLWIGNENLSVSLVEHGLASVHHTAESSEHARALKSAEENARRQRLGLWKDYVEPEEREVERETRGAPQERTPQYTSVLVTEVSGDGTVWAQSVDTGAQLEALMDTIHREFSSAPPLAGAYSARRGALCAARFTADDQWYRARVERLQEDKASVLYVDYGNRETLSASRLAALPAAAATDAPYATEYALCGVRFPTDPDDRADAVRALSQDTLNKRVLLNVESRGPPPQATLVDPANNQDIGKALIKEGLVLADSSRERRLAPLLAEYRSAQEHAKSARLNLWRHGDITEDDAVEFGARR